MVLKPSPAAQSSPAGAIGEPGLESDRDDALSRVVFVEIVDLDTQPEDGMVS